MLFKRSYQEYTTKVDGYFYDQKIKAIKIILRIRNKRTSFTTPVKDILRNKEILSTLHPVDLCIIGILANDKSVEKSCNFITAPSNYLMIKIRPVIEIVGREYQESQEILHLKITNTNKIETITATQLFNNKKLLSALKYQDALSLGFSISDSDPPVIIGHNEEQFNYLIGFRLGKMLILFILSFLLTGIPIVLHMKNESFILNSELVILPVILDNYLFILKRFPRKIANKLLLTSMSIWAMFFSYFSWINTLPFPSNDSMTLAFNQLYKGLTNSNLCYILAFFTTAMIINQSILTLSLSLKQHLSKYKQELILRLIYISIFFLAYNIFSGVLRVNSHSIFDVLYTGCLCFILHISLRAINKNKTYKFYEIKFLNSLYKKIYNDK